MHCHLIRRSPSSAYLTALPAPTASPLGEHLGVVPIESARKEHRFSIGAVRKVSAGDAGTLGAVEC